MKRKGTKDLTLTQRRKIEDWLAIGATKKQIAEQLGVCLATVYNELKRGECTQKVYSYTDYWGERHYKQVTAYSADIAEYNYRLNQSAHGAPLKIGNDFELIREIENRVISEKISACAALGRIKRENACRTIISKTTLYRYIRTGYIFTRLTMQDVKIKPKRNQKATIKRAPKGTSIEERPVEIAERNTFGHCLKCPTIRRRLLSASSINLKSDTASSSVNFSKVLRLITVLSSATSRGLKSLSMAASGLTFITATRTLLVNVEAMND